MSNSLSSHKGLKLRGLILQRNEPGKFINQRLGRKYRNQTKYLNIREFNRELVMQGLNRLNDLKNNKNTDVSQK